MNEILTTLQPIAYRLLIISLLVVLDLVGGIALALKGQCFEWKKVGDILGKYAARIVGWLLFEALALFPSDIQLLLSVTVGLAYGAYTLLLVSTGASVLAKAQALQEELKAKG